MHKDIRVVTILKNDINTVTQSEMTAVSKLFSTNPVVLYHGNKDKDMVPKYGYGSKDNDYGQGFYTTPDRKLGMEWSYSNYTNGEQGYLHSFKLDAENLKVLNFTELDSLHWLAELATFRSMDYDKGTDMVLQDNLHALLDQYKLDTLSYDVIVGYRADDSYFSYAKRFLQGSMYRETFEKALRLGKLGIQVFIKSEAAFDALFDHECTPVDKKYATFFLKRDNNARKSFIDLQYDKPREKKTIRDYLEV